MPSNKIEMIKAVRNLANGMVDDHIDQIRIGIVECQRTGVDFADVILQRFTLCSLLDAKNYIEAKYFRFGLTWQGLTYHFATFEEAESFRVDKMPIFEI